MENKLLTILNELEIIANLTKNKAYGDGIKTAIILIKLKIDEDKNE